MGIVIVYILKVILSVVLFLIGRGMGKVLSLRFGKYFQEWLQNQYSKVDDYSWDFWWLMYYLPFVLTVVVTFVVILGLWGGSVAILWGTIGLFLGIFLDLPLRNFFSFLRIVENTNFEIWNIVDIPTLQIPATIEDFTVFFVVLRDFDNHRILIDNFSFLKNAVAVYQQIHRYEIVMPVEYSSRIDEIELQFKKIICQQNTTKEFIDCDNVLVNVKSFEASSIHIELKVPVYRYLLVKRQVPILIFLSEMNKILYKQLNLIAPVKSFNWLTFTLQ